MHSWFGQHTLSLITFIPIIGILLVLSIPKTKETVLKYTALAFATTPFVLSLYVYQYFDLTSSKMQFVEQLNWIPSFNIEYFLGIDGLSLPMILLTGLLSALCIIASWNIKKGLKGYLALFLLLETGMLGVFCALDFFLFFIFWEVMLLPMYFLIGIWGGPKKEYAAIKFFLYTLVGSVLMLVALIAFYLNTDPHTFNLIKLSEPGILVGNQISLFGISLSFHSFKILLWIFLFIGFAIKVPLFPFHTWLPLAHVEAPTAISVILAGVLLKMGTYGLLRISYPILPGETLYFIKDIPLLPLLGVVNIIYGACCAMAQITLPEEKGGNDLKKLIAYSSISHMGYVILGMSAMTSEAMHGAVFQMFNHGTITAMLFLLVGVIYDQAHHRKIDGFGGLATKVPVLTGIVSVAFFAALGLPGLSGFISEALVFLGSFKSTLPGLRTFTVLATLGIILNAAFLLWALQKIFLGTLNTQYENFQDMTKRELITLVPLTVVVIFLGVYPTPMLDLMQRTLNNLLHLMGV
ncbi:MAG: NADH-quinone oxidoreductase subunit M [Deltaproteobacteria bacterium]|nr:NADH-quinone oxidoreductase subunit M [Deltaproteobacteria bacterium]